MLIDASAARVPRAAATGAGWHMPGTSRTLPLRPVVAAAAATLVALTWGFTLVSVRMQERAARSHAEGRVASLASAEEWQLNRQLQAIDQLMQIMTAQWSAKPAKFDPVAWKQQSGVLGDPSLQVSVLDTAGYVTSATRHDLIGLNLADRDYFQAHKGARRPGLFIGPAIRWKETGRWEINLSRRLDGEGSSLAGVLVVTCDPWVLTNGLEQVDLGPLGLIALVGTDGSTRALASHYEVRPGQEIAATPMFAAVSLLPQGVWTGPSAPDRVERVHAFRRIRDLDLTIVVGIDRALALRAADVWATTAYLFASGITLAVLGMAWLLLRGVRASDRRERRMAEDQAALAAAFAELEAANTSAEARSAQLEGTLAGMSDGVMLLDQRLRVVRWNERFATYTGVPPGVLVPGVPMAEVLRALAEAGEFGAVDPDAEVERRMGRLRGAEAVGCQERTRPNGRTIESRRSSLPGGGFVTLYTDITLRKQTEEARAEARRLAQDATEQKTRFVAIVSHEIRTPLNAILNSLVLLDQSVLSVPQRRLVQTARQAGDALLDLVHDILEMSRMDAGHLALRPGTCDVRSLLSGVAEMFRTQAEARGIEVASDVSRDVPAHVAADTGRLRQVVMNFVSNAIKFSSPGLVTLRADTTVLQGVPALLLAVRDQGPCIPPAKAAELFQPFSRLGDTRTAGIPGTGLGLAICERLTRVMGGQIGLGPSPAGDRGTADSGNEFWLAIPLRVAASPATPEPEAETRRRRRATVLLVEDIPANQLVSATLLRRAGHRVDIAETGTEAIRMATACAYDLVFMDLIMPGMSGYEAARHIRALPGPAGAVPIVALTATTAAEDRARCLDAGMDDMIGKPVRLDQLLDALARCSLARANPDHASLAPSGPVRLGLSDPPGSFLEPAIDHQQLADLRAGLSPGALGELVETCLTDISRRVPLLQTALAAGDTGRAEREAHTLAGLAATYGLSGMERRMRRLMAAVRTKDRHAIDEAACGLDRDLVATGEAIRTALREAA